jgi:hypothetical protein
MTMTNNEAELRTQVNKLLDFFTEPGQGEKYLKDLENDLMSLISDHTRKAKEELLEHLMTSNPAYTYEAAKDILIALKQPTVEEE